MTYADKHWTICSFLHTIVPQKFHFLSKVLQLENGIPGGRAEGALFDEDCLSWHDRLSRTYLRKD
jgi:hypothetical protein